MPIKKINGLDVHYTDQGRGPVVVLLHGFPLDLTVWEDVANDLAKDHRVISPDLRGFGKSANDKPFLLADLADDVHALLKELGALPCVLAGLSMGGYVTFYFIRKYANDLKGVALMDTKADGDTAEAKHKREQMADVAKTVGAGAVAGMMYPNMLAPDNQRNSVGDRLQNIMRGCRPETIAHACYAMRDRDDFCYLLPSILVPAALIFGEHDAITPPAKAQEMAKHIARRKITVVPGAGHMAPLEKPAEVAAALRKFVTDLDQPGAIPGHTPEKPPTGGTGW